MSIYSFERLIRKYFTSISIEVEIPGEYVNGIYVPGTKVPMIMNAAVIPMSSKQLYQSGGRYTDADKNIYTLEPLVPKTKMIYKELTYSVEQSSDYTEYGDFFNYVLKAVSVFD